jgi:hypothetical protein
MHHTRHNCANDLLGGDRGARLVPPANTFTQEGTASASRLTWYELITSYHREVRKNGSGCNILREIHLEKLLKKKMERAAPLSQNAARPLLSQL